MVIRSLIKEDNFFHQFQPIYSLDNWNLLGYEVLFRTNPFVPPESAFQLAFKEKQLYELDSRSIHKAIYTYQQAGFTRKEGKLFINVFPSTLMDTMFSSFIRNIMHDLRVSSQLTTQEIVLELSEAESIDDMTKLKNVIDEIKSHNIIFAIDDVGKGSASFKPIIELEPDYIKVDRYFTHNIHKHEKKQKVVEFINGFCKNTNSELILEGIETKEELAYAKFLGVSYGQGFILGKPNSLQSFVR